MTFRLAVVVIPWCQLIGSPLFAQDSDKDPHDAERPPVEARLIVKQSEYVLPKDRHGESFRSRIVQETDSDKLPPPPRVDLDLELKNVSDKDIMIWPRGAITYPDLIVQGQGTVEPENLRSFSGQSSGTSIQPTIKPGKTHRISIKSLNPQGGTPWIYWSEPGEYSIRATYTVYSGLPPFPFPAEKAPTGKPQRYEVTTPPVKVRVVLEQARRPLIVAHRGLLRHAPENTLANFRACLELRLGFELDVQQTSDGQLVCIHDETVERTTDGTGHLAELTLNDVRRLDAGRWFDPKFAGQKVPTVTEVFQLVAEYRQHDILVAVDLKAENVEQEVVRLAKKYKVLDRLLFIGRTISESAVRENIKAVARQAQTAAVANHAGEFQTALKGQNADWVYFRFLPTENQVNAVHDANKRAFIAGPTVSGNLPDNWRQAVAAGIDAVLTDFPLEMRAVLQSSHSNIRQ